jgi:hypothetical protein
MSSKMPCPHCKAERLNNVDHRECILELFKSNKITSVAQWERMCATRVIGGRRTVRVRVEQPPTLLPISLAPKGGLIQSLVMGA